MNKLIWIILTVFVTISVIQIVHESVHIVQLTHQHNPVTEVCFMGLSNGDDTPVGLESFSGWITPQNSSGIPDIPADASFKEFFLNEFELPAYAISLLCGLLVFIFMLKSNPRKEKNAD